MGLAIVSLLADGVAAVRRGALDEAFELFERDCGASRQRPAYSWRCEREPLSSACDHRLALVYHAQAASAAALGRPAAATLRRFVATAGGVARRFPGMLASEIAEARRQLGRA